MEPHTAWTSHWSQTPSLAFGVKVAFSSHCSCSHAAPAVAVVSEVLWFCLGTADNFCVSPQSIAALVQVSEGDLRKAITFLQSAARLNVDKEITDKAIVEIAGVCHSAAWWVDAFVLSPRGFIDSAKTAEKSVPATPEGVISGQALDSVITQVETAQLL